MASDPEALGALLGHKFADPKLLSQALTHRGKASRHSRGYERLEFLGDRVLGLVIADRLLRKYPQESEGMLARRLTALVRGETCAFVARAIGLGAWLDLSKGEADAGTRDNPAVLGDCCEAVIAALYLDGGLAAAERFITAHWLPLMEGAVEPPRDAKTALQEWTQARGLGLPTYETLEMTGPAHAPSFSVAVHVEGHPGATGIGPSKRAAEQLAAENFLQVIGAEA